MIARMNDFEWADEDIDRAEECCKLLLDAGSDLLSVQNDCFFKSKYTKSARSAFSKELTNGRLVRNSDCDWILANLLISFRPR